MEAPRPAEPKNETAFVIEDWPMSLEATRERLKATQRRLEQYRAALRLAGVEIERRNRGIISLTAFAFQASAAANPTTLLKLALVQALEITGAPTGAIVLINPSTKALIVNVHKGLTLELADILTGRQVGHGATALMPHLVAGLGALLEQATSDDRDEQLLLAVTNLTSLVSLPIQVGAKLMGALLVGLQGKTRFKSAELCFLMAMSQETAIALEALSLREGLWLTAETLLGNETVSVELQPDDQTDLNSKAATPLELPVFSLPQPARDDLEQLLAAMMEAEDEVQQQNTDLQTLNTIAELMNRTLHLKEILQYAVEQSRNILETDAAWIYLLNEQGKLELAAHSGLSPTYVRGMHQLALGESLEGQVAAESMAQFIQVTSTDTHKIWVDKEELHALAAVPITRPETRAGRSGTQVVGVLATGKHVLPPHLWTPREVRLLSSIANQFALAIDNAQLYAQLQENQASLSAGNEILREVNDMLLRRNAVLEGFVQDDLSAALITASQAITHLTSETPAETRRQAVITLQKVINRLDDMAQLIMSSGA
jgi:GAF domain-containing protein